MSLKYEPASELLHIYVEWTTRHGKEYQGEEGECLGDGGAFKADVECLLAAPHPYPNRRPDL